MKKVMIPLAAIALVGLYAGTASAQCDFNAVAAKGVSATMVRHFAQCTSTQHPTVDSSTEGGTPACANPVPDATDGDVTAYSYGVKGACKVKTQGKIAKDCLKLGAEGGACHVTYVSAQCKDILNAGLSPIGELDDGWTLATLSRATMDDPTNGDITVIDFPVTFVFSTPKKGGMKIKSNSIEALSPLVGPTNADLPICTTIQVVDVTIKDPDGLNFAKMGQATIPD